MKKLSLLLFAFVLIGCTNNSNNEVEEVKANEENNGIVDDNNKENDKDNEEEESHVNEGKETLGLAEIEDEMIYSWDLDHEMKAYLIREDGEDSVYEDTTALGNKGQKYFEGDVSFYLVYPDEDIGYLQETIEEARIDLQNKKVDHTVLDESEFIGWTTSEASVITSLYLFVIQNEELEQVAFDNDVSEPNIVTATQIKAIDDEYLQTFSYANAGEEVGYHFLTYHWDAEEKEFSEMKSTVYNPESEFPQEWYDTDVYSNFGQYKISEESIEEMKNGYLFFEDVKIGDKLVELENNDQFRLEGAHYRGAETYIVDGKFEVIRQHENDEIPEILYFPTLIDQSYADIKEVLGEPDSNFFDEMNQVDVEIYKYGDYVLDLSHDEGVIYEISLREKSEFDE